MLLYIEGTKIRNKTKCTPNFKMQWIPCKIIHNDRNNIMTSAFLARLDEVQEELLHYPGVGGGVSKMLKFYVKVF